MKTSSFSLCIESLSPTLSLPHPHRVSKLPPSSVMMQYSIRFASTLGAAAIAAVLVFSGSAFSPTQSDSTTDFSFEVSRAEAASALGDLTIEDAKRELWLQDVSRIERILSRRLWASAWMAPAGSLRPSRLEHERAKLAPKLARHILQLCERYELDPAFVLALIDTESSFKTDVRSSAGAVGLMQLMPATARVVAKSIGMNPSSAAARLEDPFTNVRLGIAYLDYLRHHLMSRGGDRWTGRAFPYYVVAAYNMGPARLEQLVAKKGFKPVATLKYFERIRKKVHDFRYATQFQVAAI
jgi:soluble lytic murein transglycosylase-like protein